MLRDECVPVTRSQPCSRWSELSRILCTCPHPIGCAHRTLRYRKRVSCRLAGQVITSDVPVDKHSRERTRYVGRESQGAVNVDLGSDGVRLSNKLQSTTTTLTKLPPDETPMRPIDLRSSGLTLTRVSRAYFDICAKPIAATTIAVQCSSQPRAAADCHLYRRIASSRETLRFLAT